MLSKNFEEFIISIKECFISFMESESWYGFLFFRFEKGCSAKFILKGEGSITESNTSFLSIGQPIVVTS